jgi:dipeptidyl aminopeptidase/acylaminoacyl peptidase
MPVTLLELSDGSTMSARGNDLRLICHMDRRVPCSRANPHRETNMRLIVLSIALIAAGTSALSAQAKTPLDTVPYYHTIPLTVPAPPSQVHASPDGKWVAYSAPGENGRGSFIWVIRTTGGAPVRVTTGDTTQDGTPVWFPDGKQIAFWTSRMNAIAAIGFDPSTGKSRGMPKRLTTGPTQNMFDMTYNVRYAVTGDGRWLVYAAPDTKAGTPLVAVPTSGGPAKQLGTVTGFARMFAPASTGDMVYFDQQWSDTRRTISRASVNAAKIEVVSTVPSGAAGTRPYPAHDRVLMRVGPRGRITTLDGRVVGSIALPYATVGWTDFIDDSTIVNFQSRSRPATKIIPFDGSPVRNFSRAGDDAEPAMWTPQGIYQYIDNPGEWGISLAPLNGARARADSSLTFVSPDGRYGLHDIVIGDSIARLELEDMRTGARRPITANASHDERLQVCQKGGGAENYCATPDGILYTKKDGENADLHLFSYDGTDRILLKVDHQRLISGDKYPTFTAVAPGASRIALATKVDAQERLQPNTVTVWLYDHGVERSALSVRGGTRGGLAFSADGRTLVGVIGDSTDFSRSRLFVLSPDSPASEPRWLASPTGKMIQMVEWVDNQSVVLLSDNQLWRVAVVGASPPQLLSQRYTGTMTAFALSPDQRNAVIATRDIEPGMMWRVSLSQAGLRSAAPRKPMNHLPER